MPITPEGKTVLTNFKKEYGKKKGKSYFYAKMKKDKGATKDWHK